MTILKSLCIAFSIYSKIPVPIFEWKDKEMKYNLIFFPWIGAVIGGLLYGWNILATYASIGKMAYVLIGVALPLLITGGFHVDGYMDTMDAFHSYKPKEDKLKILKDPHIGAFAVIMLAVIGLIYTAAFSEIDDRFIKLFSVGFVVSRALSGIAVILFPSAKQDGMLHTFSKTAKKNGQGAVLTFLVIQFLIASGVLIWLNIIAGACLILVSLAVFIYYYAKTKKELGGITGDTAGFFVVVVETSMAIVLAICSLVF